MFVKSVYVFVDLNNDCGSFFVLVNRQSYLTCTDFFLRKLNTH